MYQQPKPISKRIKMAMLLAVLSLFAFAMHKVDEPLDKLVSALQKWTDTTAHEKVYLHTDRPYYAIGDTIWFKGYVTIGSQHQLSGKSGALYVELINNTDSVTKLLKLPIISGMAKGNLVLAKPLIEGNYRIRAYTQWMRNAGPDYFYDKVLLIKNAVHENVFTNVTYQYAKSGGKNSVSVVINYTDSTGVPLRNMPVKFNLRKNYNTLYSGQGVTNVRGDVLVSLADFDTRQLQGAAIVTRADLPNFEVATKSFPLKSVATQADVQFLPEGGYMVQGYSSRVAFKATGADGLGIAVSGNVIDESGQMVGSFKSTHLGMGCFNFTPKANCLYAAKINYPDGSVNQVKLPQAKAQGYVLAVQPPNALTDSVSVKIDGGLPSVVNGNIVYLIVQSGNEVYYTATIRLANGHANLRVPLNDLPSGIAQLTLFSAQGTPMNERLIFVDNYDRIALNVKSDKDNYGRREKATFAMEAKSANGKPAIGNFSVSVINEDEVPYDDDNGASILSHLLLSSDIKGYVEKPNYYFNHTGPEVKQQLDLLMLTQGYRRFNWADIAASTPLKLRFKPESIFSNIRGRLVGAMFDRKLPYGKIYILNNDLKLFVDTITDKRGNFNFDKLLLTDGLHFSVAGRRRNGAASVHIFVEMPSKQKVNNRTSVGDIVTDFRKVVLRDNLILTKEEEARLVSRLPKSTLLKEVNINRRGAPVSLQMIKGQISQSIIFDESDAGKNVVDALYDRKIPGLKINRTSVFYDEGIKFFYNKEQMGTYVNDIPTGGTRLNEVLRWDVENVEKIDIVKNNKATGPALLIYTNTIYKPATNAWGDHELVWDITNVSPKGFDKVKDFYEPKYTYANRPLTKAQDLRTTVYWNPSVITRDGRATFSFYNNDKPGNYKVMVEGIDADGELARQVYRYKVAMNL